MNTSRISILILILSICSISFGIWHADLPFGDECGFIQTGRQIAEDGKYTSNLYIISYAIIFKFTTMDPPSAHYLLRSVSSLASTLLLYLLLKSVKVRLNELAIIAICIYWMNCDVNIPYVQYGNINIFTLNIAMMGVIFLLRKPSVGTAAVCISCFLLCARIRPEYWVAVMLVPAYLVYVYRGWIVKEGRYGILSAMETAKAGVVVLLLTLAFVFTGKEQTRNFDQYLFLGLSQCYTFLYVKINPDVKMNPMLECSSLIDEVFDKPTGFIDALKKNPIEMVNYFAVNGFANTALLIPSLLEHRKILPVAVSNLLETFLILSVPLLAILFLIRRKMQDAGLAGIFKMQVSEISRHLQINRFLTDRTDILLLVILSFVSSISIFLLIPDPRYWVSCIPLLLLWVAWGYSQAMEHAHLKYFLIVAMLMACFYMSRPMFIGWEGNRILIDMIEKHSKMSDMDNPVLAGHTSVGAYVFKKYTPLSINEMDSGSFTHGKFDYFVFDGTIVNSQFWQRNKGVLTEFINSPGRYGYMLIYVFQRDGEILAAYGRQPQRAL